MPAAARVTDPVTHPLPPVLTPGPGSFTVMIGFLPAWRALPAGVGSALSSLSNTMDSFMKTPVFTPANAAANIAQAIGGMMQLGGAAATEGNASVMATAGTMATTIGTTNTALTTAWTAASAAPGGQPAANNAYTEGIKATVAAAATAVVSGLGGLADMHVCTQPCPIPPHGPGLVCEASTTVIVDNLPLARQGDKVMEACGGANPIMMGCATVLIGG